MLMVWAGLEKQLFYNYPNELAFDACLSLYRERISKQDMVGTGIANSLASLVQKKTFGCIHLLTTST